VSQAPLSAGVADALPIPASPVRFALELLCAALLLVLFVLLLVTAGLRYAGFTAPWIYEFIRVIFVYMVGLSAIVAFARGVNLRVPGWWKEKSLSYQAVMLLLSAGLMFLTAQMLFKQGFGADASSLLGLPEGVSHIPMGLFALGLTVISLQQLRAAIRGRRA
jgi:TRAP-type C4-dicarboxylate transport system permease small subunit